MFKALFGFAQKSKSQERAVVFFSCFPKIKAVQKATVPKIPIPIITTKNALIYLFFYSY
jgi:hypothetical protein